MNDWVFFQISANCNPQRICDVTDTTLLLLALHNTSHTTESSLCYTKMTLNQNLFDGPDVCLVSVRVVW
jgi:hypothetical protein